MNLFLQAIIALPSILKMVLTIFSRIKEVEKESEQKIKLKEEIKVIDEAFKTGDASKLDKLWK